MIDLIYLQFNNFYLHVLSVREDPIVQLVNRMLCSCVVWFQLSMVMNCVWFHLSMYCLLCVTLVFHVLCFCCIHIGLHASALPIQQPKMHMHMTTYVFILTLPQCSLTGWFWTRWYITLSSPKHSSTVSHKLPAILLLVHGREREMIINKTVCFLKVCDLRCMCTFAFLRYVTWF